MVLKGVKFIMFTNILRLDYDNYVMFYLCKMTYILSLSISFPIFENPYPMDIHESPVTCTAYFADCPPDLILVLYSIGVKHKKQGYSNKVKIFCICMYDHTFSCLFI